MAEEQRPPDAERSPERVQSRDYDDFARLPEGETHATTEPGTGPAGTVETGPTNVPLVVIFIGAAIGFSAFGFRSAWPLIVGLVVVVAGAIWAGVANRGPGSMHGVGTVAADREDPYSPPRA